MQAGIFMNLGPGHGEAKRRIKWFKDNLPSRTVDYEFGAGDYQQYSDRAKLLVQRNPTAKVFVATCWPTLRALLTWTDKPIVVAGLIDAGSNYPDSVYGIKGFDSVFLCPFWPSLVKAVSGGSVTKIAVIYDGLHLGTKLQFEVIDQAVMAAGSMCSTIKLMSIPAEDVTNQSSTNLNIGKGINDWLNNDVGNNPAGLIVTAGTRTTMLRDDILAAVKQRNQTAYKLFAIYASSLFVKHASDGGIATPEGALMVYGPDLENLYKKVATDYILPLTRSHTPSTKVVTNNTFEWFVSKKAAAEVGYTIPAQLNLTLCDGSAKTLVPNPTD